VIVVRDATFGDVGAVADLHLLTFPGYFLSHLGWRFLRLFYAFFLLNENSYCIVAVDSDKVIGLVAGTLDMIQHYNAFYRRRFIQIARIIVVRFLQDPVVRRESVKRAGHLRLAAVALLQPSPQPPTMQEEGSDQTPAQLLSIAVHPGYRGKGVAERLTDFFISRLRRDGVCRVGLTVRSDNTRAIAFYEKDGWIVERVTSESMYFHRYIAEA
jgi:ribosomal protein S18 acetylase RimI-like enzyme